MPTALDIFDPRVAAWFTRTFGAPTDIQARAWPVVARGEHVLVTAPTGSGKTLTAFLYALDRLLAGAWPTGCVRVLYISPLKALNVDVQTNLMTPLAGLAQTWLDNGETPPDIRVDVRSGDTSTTDRRRQIEHPPEILITTPESLNLLLSSTDAPAMFHGLQTVILDEVHAVVDSKRGVHLITAVDRLVPLAGEFQRIALSATVRPMDTVAAFVGGYQRVNDDYVPRPVRLVQSDATKIFDTTVRYPASEEVVNTVSASTKASPEDWWTTVAGELKTEIRKHQSSLIFVNSRRLAERMALLINDGEDEPLAFSHHGSLSKETRRNVESRLKRGELSAIVATGSLELGIDVGALDEVMLLETPSSVAQTIQRLGRAGHRVGEVSRGVFYATNGHDLLLAAVMSRAVHERDLETLRPPRAPLDVLAQVLLNVASHSTWDLDDLYDEVRCSWPYRELTRKAFDLVVDMLAGRYGSTKLPALRPRAVVDQVANTFTARPEALRTVRLSGGTIPDRGYFAMRSSTTKAKLGELDEEFVWERRVGDTFVMGAQAWKIDSVGANDVLVHPSTETAMAPFWRAEDVDRDARFSDRVGERLEEWNAGLDDPALPDRLQRDCDLDRHAALALVGYLQRQRSATGCDLPHRHHLVAENIVNLEKGRGLSANDDAGVHQLVLHTLWGNRLNRPFGLALAGALQDVIGEAPRVQCANDAVVVVTEQELDVHQIIELVTPSRVEELMRGQLEHSGYFGARFREAAGRALLLPRGLPGRRIPLWLTRQKAKQLLELVGQFPDFPIVLEAWRTCLQDGFDLPALRERLGELADGTVQISAVTTLAPSPFAEGVAWHEVNVAMYLDDTPTGGRTHLSDELIAEVVYNADLRPRIPRAVATTFAAKMGRTEPGYAPESADELVEALKDRVLLSRNGWRALLTACERDHGLAPDELTAVVADRVVACGDTVLPLELLPQLAAARTQTASRGTKRLTAESLVANEPAPQLTDAAWRRLTPNADTDALAELLASLLATRGPLALSAAAQLIGVDVDQLEIAADALADDERAVVDRLTEDADELEICHPDHLERLLRLARASRRPTFAPRPLADLPLWLADRTGLTRPASSADELAEHFGRLFGWSASPESWEGDLLPARSTEYQLHWLDDLMAQNGLLWLGVGPEKLTFAPAQLIDIFKSDDVSPDAGADLPVPAEGRHRLRDLAGDDDPQALHELLWKAAWKGLVTCDSAQELRRRKQRLAKRESSSAPTLGRRLPRQWWKAAHEAGGGWYRLPNVPPSDELDRLERDKDRVRLLIDRYGVLCKALVRDELPALRWSALFRAARLMELSGELVAGQFFDELPGVQFTTPPTLAQLRDDPPRDAVYWFVATDPASLCGAGLPELGLPERRPTTHLVYHGERLVVVSRRRGGDLEIRVAPDDPALERYFGFLQSLAKREPKGVDVQTINDEPVRQSAYARVLSGLFPSSVGPNSLRVWARG